MNFTASGATAKRASETIVLDDGASVSVPFQITAIPLDPSQSDGYATLSVAAIADSGDQDALQKTLPVERSEVFETTSYIGATVGNSLDETLDLTGVDRDRATLELHTSASLF